MKFLMKNILVLNQKTLLITFKEIEKSTGEDLAYLVSNLKNLDELNENILKENKIEVEELKLEVLKVREVLRIVEDYRDKKIEKPQLLKELENIKNKKVEIKKVEKARKEDLEEIFKMLRRDLVTDRVHIDMNELAEFEETEDALMFCNKILDPYLDRYFKGGNYSNEERDEMKDRIFDIVRG
jgi:flagellar biosynthesis GTPase FlhF